MSDGIHTVTNTMTRVRGFRYALIFEGVLVGAAAGVVTVLFRILLEKANGLLQMALDTGRAHPWFIAAWFVILAAAALAVSLLLKWEPFISGSGIPQVEGEMQGELDQCWWKVLLAKCAGGLLSLGCGLSLGREGPSIQLGAVTAKGFSRLTHRVKTEEKLLLTCGASAGLAAAFNAPIAGVLFSLEEIHKNFSPEVLLSTMASSITADFISRNVFGLKPVFTFDIPNMIPLAYYGHAVALGLLLGLMGLLYNVCLEKTQNLYQLIPQRTIRVMIPFLLAGILGFTYPDVLGGGHNLIEPISAGGMLAGALVVLLIVKFCFSMISFGSGAPGGIFLPLLVMGALIGAVYCNAGSALFGLPSSLLSNFIILGMAGFFSAIVRAPITGIILISEMTGSFSHLLTLCIVSLMAYLVPDFLHCKPVYDQLLHRLLAGRNPSAQPEPSMDKVLMNTVVRHGSEAEGKQISEVSWPATSLVVSVMRGEQEFVPKGNTQIRAGDRLVLLCEESEAGHVHRTLEERCERVHIET